MTPFLLPLFLGALTFTPEILPGIEVGRVDPLTGVISLNARHTDLDGDGRLDLITHDRVIFYTKGSSSGRQVPLPGFETSPLADVAGRTLYLKYPDRLVAYTWDEGQWRRHFDFPWQWPHQPEVPWGRAGGGRTRPGLRFTRFLFDLSEEGGPQIVLPADDGLHVFRRTEEGYEPWTVLPIFPQHKVSPWQGRALWPAAERSIIFPSKRMACEILMSDDAIRVITRIPAPPNYVRFRVHHYNLPELLSDSQTPPVATVSETAPLPPYVEACDLNGDGLVDFAGGQWRMSADSFIPLPIYETAATVDAGKLVQTFRTRSFRPFCSFVDLDGDGDKDILTESTSIGEGGVRETVSRYFTDKTLTHEVRIHYQDSLGRFSRQPDLTHRFTLHLEKAPFHAGSMFRAYQAGQTLRMTGDFDGDGYRDALIWDRPDRLSVYLNHHNYLSDSPDATLPIAHASFATADIDGDGRSDVLVIEEDPLGHGSRIVNRVFFSRATE